VPHFIVWGDFRDKVAVWQRLPIVPTTYRDAIVAAGGKADVFDLPVMGIKEHPYACRARWQDKPRFGGALEAERTK
jgi:hypothetical protein